MSTPLLPNDELVAMAWLIAAVPLAAGKVATKLPDPPWTDNEFVQVMQVGGGADLDNPIANPVVSCNCFAMKPNSTNPPWGQAAHLAQSIWLATFQIRYAPDDAVELDMPTPSPTPYGRAVVRTVSALTRPRRIPSDPSQYAVYNVDIELSWIPASVVISRG